ncbi:MAG: hypothetical protein JWP44_4301, partial [Mucilaginibacter sp.]|nr:hypothetical protein [Mucilaginibacter sp.]
SVAPFNVSGRPSMNLSDLVRALLSFDALMARQWVLPLKLADGVLTRLADGHRARAQSQSVIAMAISRLSGGAAW